MTRFLKLSGLAVLALVLVLTCTSTVCQAGGVLNVNDCIFKHYRGSVRVKGVVSGVSPIVEALDLTDVRGPVCGPTSCATPTLVVSWTGPMPAVKDVVVVEGRAVETDGQLTLKARRLKVIAHKAGE